MRVYRWRLPSRDSVQELDREAVVVIWIRTRRVPFLQQAGKEDRSWGCEKSGSHRTWGLTDVRVVTVEF